MDVFQQQIKLTKTEWESIEVPVSDAEKRILGLIQDGYHDLTIQTNDHSSMLSFLKMEYSAEMEQYLFVTYFVPYIQKPQPIVKIKSIDKSLTKAKSMDKIKPPTNSDTIFDTDATIAAVMATMSTSAKSKPPKKSDMIRLQHTEANIATHRAAIFEYKLLDLCIECIVDSDTYTSLSRRQASSPQKERRCDFGSKARVRAAYTLIHMRKAAIAHVNVHVWRLVDAVVAWTKNRYVAQQLPQIGAMRSSIVRQVFDHAYDVIERNPDILRYDNRQLYDHQKQLFRLFGGGTSTSTIQVQNERDEKNDKDEPADIPPMLVLYTAPTGTGKTVSPLGLAMGPHRIIYICAARHVGLALARSAISMQKRVAFAFGCETASDIRLHYYSAVDFTRNRKSGGIYKVDNSNGSQIEIMICDVGSYLVAMYYMLSFFDESRLILYWDEPTISLDVPDHPLHATIHDLWAKNKISRIIWSCATLPRECELTECFAECRERFDGIQIRTIASYDCKKTTTLLDPTGCPILPHTIFAESTEIAQCMRHFEENPVLLRYVDVREIVAMVQYVTDHESMPDGLEHTEHTDVCDYFKTMEDVTMHRIKEYYISLLREIAQNPEFYATMHRTLRDQRRPLFDRESIAPSKDGILMTKTRSMDAIMKSANPVAGAPLTRMQSTPVITHTNLENGCEKVKPASTSTGQGKRMEGQGTGILLTTLDAHTLTDGPTLFLTEDVAKIGKFYLQQTKIPIRVLDGILEKITANNQIQKRMDVLMKSLDDMLGDESEKDKKVEKGAFKPEVKRMMAAIEVLRADIKTTTMDPALVPNTRPHQQVWVGNDRGIIEQAFVPFVEESTVRDIMELDVDTQKKVLLLLGIGVFDHSPGAASSVPCPSPCPSPCASSVPCPSPCAVPCRSEIRYMEIMKQLAYQQYLYLIIASSDYIYGTNYQFCHAFLGKDLANMTQQKILQAMGRVGRGNVQQEYTIRFRDESLLSKLWLPATSNIEAENMCRLFRFDT